MSLSIPLILSQIGRYIFTRCDDSICDEIVIILDVSGEFPMYEKIGIGGEVKILHIFA